LDSCPVASETFDDEAAHQTPLHLRAAVHALAVATSAVTGMRRPPQPLRARTITRTAHFAARSTDSHRGKLTLARLVLLGVSVLALLTDVSALAATGIVGFGAGAVLLTGLVQRRKTRTRVNTPSR
jgi:hypothetical protein